MIIMIMRKHISEEIKEVARYKSDVVAIQFKIQFKIKFKIKF